MRLPLFLLVALAAASCTTTLPAPSLIVSETAPPSLVQEEDESGMGRPTPDEDSDWIRLVSGEWLRGELTMMQRGIVEFDSDELDDLELDYEDIDEILTVHVYTVLLEDRRSLVGRMKLLDTVVTLDTDEGDVEVPREQVLAFVPGRPTESNYWSGDVRFSATIREGNTDQVDNVISISAKRETAASRLSMFLESVTGTLDGSENANNQTFSAGYDYYLSRRTFVRPFGIEVFADRIQNIDYRISPFAGAGYTFVDSAKTEWDGILGVGYRYTKFESVEAGEDDSSETTTAVIQTKLESDLTSDIELGASYGVDISLEEVENTDHEARLSLSFEFVWDLDFDVNFVWKYVGNPAADSSGDTPEQNDLRIELGLTWEF